MKHFVVSLITSAFAYDFKCSQINEAYHAVFEASVQFGISVNLDRIMHVLVYMDEGKTLSYEHGRIRIAVREGEV